MKLLERFRNQPAWQSADPSVRLAAVKSLPDGTDVDDILLDVARSDDDPRVRLAAVERMTDLVQLVSLLEDPHVDDETRSAVTNGVTALVVELTDEVVADQAIRALKDERSLGVIARTAENESIGLAALQYVVTDRALSAVARNTKYVVVALEAVRRMADPSELTVVAVKSDDKATALAAYERLTTDQVPDDAMLEEIVRKARQKGVARRAREALDNRRGQGVPEGESVQSRAAAVLCEQIEKLAETVDDLEQGRKELDTYVETWSQFNERLNVSVTERFASARRNVEDRLLALDALSAEKIRISERQSALELVQTQLCVLVEQLEAANALSALKQARQEWQDLKIPLTSSGETTEQTSALIQRFEAATIACEKRVEQFVQGQACLQQLELLIGEMEHLVESGDTSAIGKNLVGLNERWRREMAAISVLTGRDDAVDALKGRKKAVDSNRKAIESTVRDAHAESLRQNLMRLLKLINVTDQCVTDDNLTLSKAERRLRNARETLDDLPSLPTRRDREEIAKKLKQSTTALLGKVRELRDFSDWQRWANLGIQEELCRRMEALLKATQGEKQISAAEVVSNFRALMKRWRQVSDVSREKGQLLWRRFKTAHDEVYPRCEKFFTEQKVERERNHERRLALVKEAEGFRESTDWLKTAARLKTLQGEWKALGPVHRKDRGESWENFRAACDVFFKRRKTDLAERKRVWTQNLKQKEALCAEVEALVETEDLAVALNAVKRTQEDWKRIGPVRRNRSEDIWGRFRQACDNVTERSKAGEREIVSERIAVRDALCAEVEALVGEFSLADDAAVLEQKSEGDGSGLFDKIQAIQIRWRQAPDLQTDVRRKFSTRFGRALARVIETHPDQFRGTDLDPVKNLKRLESLCEKVEGLVRADENADGNGSSPAEILAQQWRERLAANTIGGSVGEHGRRRTRLDEVKRLQVEQRRLGPFSGAEADALVARFRRACDRVYQENASDAVTS